MKVMFLIAAILVAVSAIAFTAVRKSKMTKELALSDTFIPLAEGFMVSPQISPDQVAQAAAQGVTLIINNRPDDEAPGQPKSAEIAKAAEAAGIRYVEIFVDRSGISPAHLDAFDAALADQTGKTLAFCRTGARSTTLRSYAAARAGMNVDAILSQASAAGYDLKDHRPTLEALAASATNGD